MGNYSDWEMPNGGWGWMVVLGMALINMFNQSLISVFGLLFGDHLAAMGQTTSGAVLVININAVFLNFTGILAGPMLRIFSPRTVCIAGNVMVAAGLMLSSLATNLWQILASYSCLVGIGLGLISPASFIAVNAYFTTKRGRAVGLALAGTGLGQMLMPHLVRSLLEAYGFRWTALILGALSLHGLVGALLFHPVEWHLRRPKDEGSELQLLIAEKRTHMKSEKEEVSFGAAIMQSMNLQLLRDVVFCNIAIGLALVYSASANFSMILPYFLQDSVRNLTRSDTAYCMSILAAGDILSRLTLPTLTDRFHISCRSIFLCGVGGLLVARSCLAETTERPTLLLMCAIYGFIRAATVVNQSLVVAEYVGDRSRLAGAIGLNMCSRGVFALVVGQTLGWVRDATGSFAMVLHAQNSVLAVVLVAWLAEIWAVRCRNR